MVATRFPLMHRALRAGLALLLVFAALPLTLRSAPAGGALPYGEGLLWRIDVPQRAPSYLLGTMHVTDPAIVRLPQPVAAAFDATGLLIIEMVLTPEVSRAMGQAMLLGPGRSLDAMIGATMFRHLVEVGANYGLGAESLKRLKPWAAMTILSTTPEELARQAAGHHSLDEALQKAAESRGRPVRGLETVEEQLAVFDTIPEDEQIELLGAAVNEAPKIAGWLEQIKQAYLARDTGLLHGLMRQQAAGSDEDLVRAFEDRLIATRNHRMAERMTILLDGGGAFVAVGALHLPGEEGVLNLLAERGYALTRVY